LAGPLDEYLPCGAVCLCAGLGFLPARAHTCCTTRTLTPGIETLLAYSRLRCTHRKREADQAATKYQDTTLPEMPQAVSVHNDHAWDLSELQLRCDSDADC
jgi:hypothetical protein